MRGPGWFCEPMLLSITTRGIGLNVCSVYADAIRNSRNRNELPDIHAVYRAMLAIAETKLYKLGRPFRKNSEQIYNRRDNWRLLEHDYFYSIPVTLQRMIEAIGIIEIKDEGVYFPVMSKNTVIDGEFMPRPENILLSNLRETVVALADPGGAEAAVLHRNNFYQNNPIPAAKWDQNHTLMNAEQIMPAQYDLRDLDEDLRALNFFQSVTYKFHREPQRVNFNNAIGSKAILISSEMSGLRTPDLRPEETLITYYQRAQPENDVNSFYSLVNLSDEELMTGATMLLGEQPTINTGPQHSVYALRSKTLNPFSFQHSYKHSSYVQLSNN